MANLGMGFGGKNPYDPNMMNPMNASKISQPAGATTPYQRLGAAMQPSTDGQYTSKISQPANDQNGGGFSIFDQSPYRSTFGERDDAPQTYSNNGQYNGQQQIQPQGMSSGGMPQQQQIQPDNPYTQQNAPQTQQNNQEQQSQSPQNQYNLQQGQFAETKPIAHASYSDMPASRNGDYQSALQQSLSGKVNNPYLDQMAQGITRNVTDNLQQNIMPGIGNNAEMAGQYGGSRQGIAQGLASSRANQDIAGQLANMYGSAQNQASQLQGSTALQLAGQQHASDMMGAQLKSQQAMQENNLSHQDAWNNQNYNLGLQNSNNSFYTQNRGLDQSGFQLGANLFQNGVNGNQSIGQNQTNIGQQYYDAPNNAINNFSNTLHPYTGYNNSNTTQNSGGSGSKAGQWIGGLTAGAGLLNAAGGVQGISNWWNG